MTREPSFPFDWLKPGECRFCRCGFYRLPAGVAVCAICRGGSRAERAATLTADAEIAARLNSLASERRASGMPPLFWVEAAP